MSINVADNFSYQGSKPLDARFQFSTVANMKAYAEASLYNGCLAYITGTKEYYTYDSSNSVDATTGRWRIFESGGSSTLTDLTDTTISSPSNGQVLAYDSATSKWKNSNASGGASSLNELSDVTISSASNGQVLKHNGTSWVNGDVPSDTTKQPKTLASSLTIDDTTVTTVESALSALNDLSLKYKVTCVDAKAIDYNYASWANRGSVAVKSFIWNNNEIIADSDLPLPAGHTSDKGYNYLCIVTKDEDPRGSTSFSGSGDLRVICYVLYQENNITIIRQFMKVSSYSYNTLYGKDMVYSTGNWYEIGAVTSSITSGSEVAVASGAVFNAFTTTNTNLKDSTPTSGSQKPITSGGAYTATVNKYDTSDTSETALADSDYFPFQDVSASAKRKTLWSNIKSVLKTYFDTLYSTVKTRGTATSGGTDLSLVNTGDMYAWNNKQDVLTAGTNIGISGTTISATNTISLNYSTSEQVVGTWLDGKTLYQRSFTATVPNTDTGTITFTTSFNSSYKIKNVEGGVEWYVSASRYGMVPINYNVDSTSTKNHVQFIHDAAKLQAEYDGSWFKNKAAWVTVQYTKS